MALEFPDPYPMERWTNEEFQRFEPISDGLEKYGYFISSEPIDGQFDRWIDGLKKSLKSVELNAELIRGALGYRGVSKNLLAALHSALPEPSWSVELQPSKEAYDGLRH